MLLYSVILPKLTDGILFSYLDKKGTSVIAIFSYIMDKTHFIISAYLFIALVLALIAAICFIPDERVEKTRQFITLKHTLARIPFIKKRLEKNSLFASYFINISRRADTLNLGLITVFSYIMAVLVKIEHPEYAVMIYVINGLYMCVQTEGIRNLLYQKYYDVIKDYMYMIFSQIIYIFIVSVPFTFLSLFNGNDLKDVIFMYGIMFLFTVFGTFIGIVFVPKRENPISVMIGMFATIVFVLIIALGMYILQIGKIGQVLSVLILLIITIYYSLIGLVSLRKESYYGY